MLQKDQKLGIIAFSLFVILCTQIALLLTYNGGQVPQLLIVSIGTVFALFVGFVIWGYCAHGDRENELIKQQEIIDNEDRE